MIRITLLLILLSVNSGWVASQTANTNTIIKRFRNGNQIFKSNGKFGMLDSNNIIKQVPIFDSIVESDWNCYDSFCKGYFAYKGGLVRFLNRDAIWSPEKEFEYIDLILYIHRYKGVVNDSIWFFNCTGELFSNEYDSLWYNNSNFIVEKNKKFGSVDMNNKVLIPIKYEELYAAYNISKYLIAKKDGKYGVVNYSDSIIIPFIYDMISATMAKNGTDDEELIIEYNGKVGTINIRNEYVIKPEYDNISGWCCGGPNGHYIIKGKFQGFITTEGNILIPPIYDGIYASNNGFIVSINRNVGVVNNKNEIIIPLEYKVIYSDMDLFLFNPKDTIDDKYIVFKNNEWLYLSKRGSVLKRNVKEMEIKRNYPDLYEHKEGYMPDGDCFVKERN